MIVDTIIPGKDYYIEVLVAEQDGVDGTPVPATGREDVKVIFSATDGGDAIADELSVVCEDTEETRTAVIDGKTLTCQVYAGELVGADTLEELDVGATIYQRTEIGAHSRDSFPIKVRTRQ